MKVNRNFKCYFLFFHQKTLRSLNLPRKITVSKVDLFEETKIAHEFNSFVTNEGKNLAKKIPNASTPFEYFVNKSDFVMETKPLSMNGLEDAFYSLKSNESPGNDNISYNKIKKCFGSLRETLKYLSNLSIEKGVFPDDLKIAQVIPFVRLGT